MEFKFAPGVVVPKDENEDHENDDSRLDEMVRTSPSMFAAAAAAHPVKKRDTRQEEHENEDDEESYNSDQEQQPSIKKKAKTGLGSPRLFASTNQGNTIAPEKPSCCRGLLTYAAIVLCFTAAFACFLLVPLPTWKFSLSPPSPPPHALFQGTHRKQMQFSQAAPPKHVLADVERSLQYHLSTAQNTFACLCMHHLSVATPLQKVCGVYNPYMQRVHLMTEPKIVGHGELTDLYEERPITSTMVKMGVKRYRNVFVQWADAASGDVLTLQLHGMQAVCMQVAVEEMTAP